MRKTWWIGTLMLSAALVLPALAQQPDPEQAKSFFTGVNPRTIKEVKVNPNRALQRSNMGRALQQPAAQQRSSSPFSLGSYFPRVTLASWPPKLPSFAAVKTPSFPKSTLAPASSVNLFNQPPK